MPTPKTFSEPKDRPRVGPRTQPKRGTPGNRPSDVAALRAGAFDTSDPANIALIHEDKVLTPKMRIFVKHWAQGESIRAASHMAGYDDKAVFAYRIVKYANVLKLYNEEKRLYEEASQMTRKKVMDMLIESYDMAKLAGEPASMVSAAREVGKMCGYYEPTTRNVNVTLSGSVVLDRMNRLSDAELLDLIKDDISDALVIENDTDGSDT